MIEIKITEDDRGHMFYVLSCASEKEGTKTRDHKYSETVFCDVREAYRKATEVLQEFGDEYCIFLDLYFFEKKREKVEYEELQEGLLFHTFLVEIE